MGNILIGILIGFILYPIIKILINKLKDKTNEL